MKNHKWLKWLLIFLAVVVLTIFFGSIAFNIFAWGFDILGWLFGLFATALRWLGNLFDFFGFAAVFSAHADARVCAEAITNIIQILRVGG